MTSTVVAVRDASQVAEARRGALAAARALGMDAETEGRVALGATELATNLVKHGRGGELVITARPDDDASGVELLALDSGPGMDDWTRCLRDGFSTAGSPGTGLGAILRASEAFDVYSRPSLGTGVFARIGTRRPHADRAPRLVAGAVSVPFPGELECGDAWTTISLPTVTRMLLVDGLGHGVSAAEAARAAVGIFCAAPNDSPGVSVQRMHDGTRHTRGSAAAVAQLEPSARTVVFCGVGNVAGVIVSADGVRHMVSHNGTLGHEARRIQVFSYPWNPGSLLVMHSDGIATHWRMEDYPGLATRHPALVAGFLYRDFRRGRDDATILVVALHRDAPPQDLVAR